MADFFKPKTILITSLILPIIILVIIFSYIGIINKPKDRPIQEQEEVEPPKSPQGMFSEANLEVGDFSFTEYIKIDNAVQKSFELSGRKLQTKNPKIGIFRVAIGKVVELEKPKITFYKDSLPVSSVNSNTGAINPLNKGISFYGDVGLITEDKRILTCNKLKWDNEQKYLLAEGDCFLGAEGKVIRAEMIKTDVELKNFNIVSKNDSGWLRTVRKLFTGRER